MRTPLIFCILISPAHSHDPELDLSAVEMIRYWGYPAEEVQAVTEDGYILTMHRIPHGKDGGAEGSRKPIIFMQHGLLCDSTNWFANLPNNSAGEFERRNTRTEVYIAHTPSGTSSQNIQHWGQQVNYGTVARFDYDNAEENEQHYGQPTPPAYNFTTIKTDMYLYWSDNDWIANPVDVEESLLPTLNPDYIKGNTRLTIYSHLDYIWGMNAAIDIYQPIIDVIMDEMEGEKVGCS